MSKSSWKFNYINTYIFKKMFLSKFKSIKIKKLFCRNSSLPELFNKKSVNIYKGNGFAKILFNKYYIGHKVGEFSITRKPFNFPLKNTKKSKR